MEERKAKSIIHMHLSESLKLYGILGSESLRGNSHAEAVTEAIKGGITCVQIREKHLSKQQLLGVISEIKPICDEAAVPLIINDDVEICKVSDANGVHLGLSDGSIVEARKLLGDDKIIGATAHNLEEAIAAEAEGADYVGVGAAFGSNSKGNAVKLPSLEVYNQITDSVKIPTIAIGGINTDNIGALAGRHLAGVAVISALFGAQDIKKSAEVLRNMVNKLQHEETRTEI
ncbi:thiamine phosphate synthase [Mogibacterium pumilum]|uniref:Thiamine-phosphate synthase n=1 Tax=Mogibacterium pumilum TaxID=86332 RepID=A0A223ARP9_9FIRM|nr:thiamine phosphate synthase [Mogibacterium pumilum]ASS37626.1 thiamine-phosphate diphosphorylase [Mogibacterium pumilum]